jgi:DNA mismatch repair ATPase MutS
MYQTYLRLLKKNADKIIFVRTGKGLRTFGLDALLVAAKFNATPVFSSPDHPVVIDTSEIVADILESAGHKVAISGIGVQNA